MKIAITLTAASIIGFSSFAAAEQELSMIQMDIVSAGGSAAADALADAVGYVTASNTNTVANVISQRLVQGQLGGIHWIESTGVAQSASNSDGEAIGTARAAGVAAGSLLADTTSFSQTDTNSGVGGPPAVALLQLDEENGIGGLPYSLSNSNNSTVASTILIGNPASSSSASSAGALLHNAGANGNGNGEAK